MILCGWGMAEGAGHGGGLHKTSPDSQFARVIVRERVFHISDHI